MGIWKVKCVHSPFSNQILCIVCYVTTFAGENWTGKLFIGNTGNTIQDNTIRTTDIDTHASMFIGS